MRPFPVPLSFWIGLPLVLVLASGWFPRRADAAAPPSLPPASWNHLPRWRGFNLLEKFSKDWNNGPFQEEDFRLISKLGFNFVRLPLDYRVWIKNGDWNQVDEQVLKEIDQAVAWGKKYGIHVCVNFHRAPGYCINPPKEPKSLWSDPEAQKVCAKHWALFARRYKGIPNNNLSFDLFNEPSGVSNADYAKVAGLMVKAIHAEDPNRLVIADGNDGGSEPVPDLATLKVAQAGRGYQPFSLTHYKASWVEGSDTWPAPQWPSPLVTANLYGPQKPDLAAPFALVGNFPKGSTLRLRIQTVSGPARLVVRADGKPVLEKTFQPGPGKGEWKESIFRQEWNVYQNLYDRDYTASLPDGAKRVELALAEGDWLNFSELEVKPKAGKPILVRPSNYDWGLKASTLYLRPDGSPDPARNAGMADRDWLRQKNVEPWKKLEAWGVGVMIGEWGAYRFTPHDVALRWMKDCLENWKEAGFGWALWNFRGDFGVLDSGRKDVPYEDFEGHQLDRQMLELLQNY